MPIVRSLLLSLLWVCLNGGPALATSPSDDASQPKQPAPNIVLIVADDWGWGDLGCHGHPYVRTPHLDALAASGLDFHRFTVASGVCSPSRAAILTGQFPARLNINGHFAQVESNARRNMPDWLAVETPTLPRYLRAAGYRTGHFGKWHLANNMIPDSPRPEAYGYDVADAFNCSGVQLPVHDDVREAVTFLKATHAEGKPFFINLWMHEPHTPFHTVPKYRWPFRTLPDDDRYDKRDEIYASVLAHADARIGELMTTLDELELIDDTLVIFTSDNGPARAASSIAATADGLALMHDTATGAGYNVAASRGLTGQRPGYKASLYQGGVCVPFIVSWPGHVPSGAVDTTTPLSAVDLLPTLCELAGVTLPNTEPLDGVSQVDAFKGNATPQRSRPLFWHMETRARRSARPHHWTRWAVQFENHVLLTNDDGSTAELYNTLDDPLQQHDLATSQPDVVRTLQQQLDSWRSTLPASPTGDVFSGLRTQSQ